jgi:hypothetical protein
MEKDLNRAYTEWRMELAFLTPKEEPTTKAQIFDVLLNMYKGVNS